MEKNKLSIIYLILLFLVIAFITVSWFYNSNPIQVGNKQNINTSTHKQVDIMQLTVEYKLAVSEIISQYQVLLQGRNLDGLEDLKNKLMALTVPKEYMQQHAQLVLSFDALASDGNFEQAQEKLEQLITAYGQL